MSAAMEKGNTGTSDRKLASLRVAKYLKSIMASETLASQLSLGHGWDRLDYENVLRRTLGEKRSMKIKLLDGELLVTEFPFTVHGRFTSAISAIIATANVFGAGDPLQGLGSTTYYAIDQEHGIEPDSSFCNRRVPKDLVPLDTHRSVLPTIVIDVALLEEWDTIMRTVRAYFDLGVLQVIHFKCFQESDETKPSHIRVKQMFMMNFLRPEDYTPGMVIQATQVISFGSQPHHKTVAAILHHTRVNEANFTGFGRHGYDQPCRSAGNPVYQFKIPATVIWHNVPPEEIIPPVIYTDIEIDLFTVIDGLILNLN